MGLEALLTKREVDDDEEMPMYPGLTVTTHVLGKTAPFGFITGGVVGLMFGKGLRWSANGFFLGTLAGAAMLASTAIRKENFDADGVKDRAYRLVHNDAVRRFDEHVMVAAPLSLGLVPLMKSWNGSLFHKGTFAVGCAFTGCFIWMVKEVGEQKAKQGEKAIRTME